jgi:hypothetical protein
LYLGVGKKAREENKVVRMDKGDNSDQIADNRRRGGAR